MPWLRICFHNGTSGVALAHHLLLASEVTWLSTPKKSSTTELTEKWVSSVCYRISWLLHLADLEPLLWTTMKWHYIKTTKHRFKFLSNLCQICHHFLSVQFYSSISKHPTDCHVGTAGRELSPGLSWAGLFPFQHEACYFCIV